MMILGKTIGLDQLYDAQGQRPPGDHFARHTIEFGQSYLLYGTGQTQQQAIHELPLSGRGMAMIVAKDRDTLVGGLGGLPGAVTGVKASFALVWGDYGGGTFSRWRAAKLGREKMVQNFRDTGLIGDRRHFELLERASYIFVLSREETTIDGKRVPGYRGDADIKFINSIGSKIDFKSLAFFLNGRKENSGRIKWARPGQVSGSSDF